MTELQTTERLQELRRLLDRHNHLYHVLDQPEIGDDQYDALMAELRALEEAHPELITPESPTQRVGAQPAEGFADVVHPVAMLSLANAFEDEGFLAWYARRAETLERDDYDMVCELKYDGAAVALTYEDGVFVQGATRGTGLVGERGLEGREGAVLGGPDLHIDVGGRSWARPLEDLGPRHY